MQGVWVSLHKQRKFRQTRKLDPSKGEALQLRGVQVQHTEQKVHALSQRETRDEEGKGQLISNSLPMAQMPGEQFNSL